MENKIHIVLAYYKRPKIVLNALHSIINSTYNNWILTVIDDSGDRSFEQILNSSEIPIEKINYVSIGDTETDKQTQGGSRHGQFINNNIREIKSDIVVILCDDDALHSQYLEYLNDYYNLNKSVNWSYCKLYFYNPDTTWYHESGNCLYSNYTHPGSTYNLNHHNQPLNPAGNLDSSQVSFRTSIFDNINVGYPSPQTRGLDYSLFNSIYNEYGDCYPNFIYGQYKACFSNQLGNRWIDKQTEY